MKKIFALIPALLLVLSCEMDFKRSDTMTSAMMKENPSSAEYTTNGLYSMLKDVLLYHNQENTRCTYIREYFQLTEFRGDNVCLSNMTTDPLTLNIRYEDIPNGEPNGYFWYVSYKIIFGANSNIEVMPEGASPETDHILGENYFLRAFCHLNLVNIFAKPYTRDKDAEGVVLRLSTDCSETSRASVEAVYTQVEKDLIKAAELMKGGKRRGDKGFIDYEAAMALLVRVYLYMGKDDECINTASELLGDDPASHLEAHVADYYPHTRTSKETLWCIAVEPTDHQYSEKSQIASMYYTPDSDQSVGWKQMFASDPLVELFERYPSDERYVNLFPLSCRRNDGTKMVHWPYKNDIDKTRQNFVQRDGVIDNNDGTYTFTLADASPSPITVKQTTINTYKVHYIDNGDGPTADTDDDGFYGGIRVYVRDAIDFAGMYESYPGYMCTKFSYQDGQPLRSSPAMLRWAEVILNRAEAYAHKNDPKALDDVNIIRMRAGLSGDQLMKSENIAERGYSSLLDVVLDERRLELSFEGFRALDLYRNNRGIDRRFAGVQDWEVLSVEQLDQKFPYVIPFDETSITGITNNR